MGFYIKKAVKAGPFRFNLSKSGVGVSVGVKGLRIGSGPRGNYVHVGRGGLYFRRSLDPAGAPKPSASTQPSQAPPISPGDTVGPMQEIESVSALEMTDSSAQDLLSEINGKLRKAHLFPIAIAVTVAAIVGLLLFSGPPWAVGLAVVLGALLSLAAWYRDAVATSVVVLYDFDKSMEGSYSGLHEAFDDLMKCGAAWHISSAGDVIDRKYHAGASRVLSRTKIKPVKGQPRRMKTNIEVPLLEAGRQTLAFMPERLLVFESRAVGAVPYPDLAVEVGSSRFIEEEGVPEDSEVVDHTWRYVNKKGGPDQRFKDNPRLPIVLYEDIRFTSSSGLNEQFKVSKVGTGAPLVEAIRRAAALLSSAQEPEHQETG
jgi:hypothetical protein